MERLVVAPERAVRSPSRWARADRARPGAAVLSWIEREALLVTAVAAYAAALLWHLPKGIRQDTWLALVGGREVVQHGIPHEDALTVWGGGTTWIDQPWLAQVAFYGLETVGGIALAALVATLATFAAFALAVATARGLGASSLGILWIVLPAGFLLALSSWHLRTQSFAYPLFALLLWLLLHDSRRSSRRVYLVLPVLALWANVHGSVVLGVGLVALYALTFAAGEARRATPLHEYATRTSILLVGAPVALFLSPYGTDLVHYYRGTLLSPAFRDFVSEWQPIELNLATLPFFGLLFVGLWALGRGGVRRPGAAFETLAFAFLALASVSAIRNLVWFALAAIAILPALLGGERDATVPARRHRRLNLTLVLASGVAVVVLAVVTLARFGPSLDETYPDDAATAVATAASERPDVKVFADVRYADWLLWQVPELRGRVALDARFELLERSELRALYDFRNGAPPDSRRAVRGFDVAVLAKAHRRPMEALAGERGARILYANETVAVVSRAAG